MEASGAGESGVDNHKNREKKDLRGQKEIVEGRGWCQIWGKVEPFFNKQMEN